MSALNDFQFYIPVYIEIQFTQRQMADRYTDGYEFEI